MAVGKPDLPGYCIFGAFTNLLLLLQTLGEKKGSLHWGGVQFTTKKVTESEHGGVLLGRLRSSIGTKKKKEEFYWDEKEVVEEPSTTRGRTSITGLHRIHRLGNANGPEKWRKVKDKEQAMRILGIGSNVNEAEGAKPVKDILSKSTSPPV